MKALGLIWRVIDVAISLAIRLDERLDRRRRRRVTIHPPEAAPSTQTEPIPLVRGPREPH